MKYKSIIVDGMLSGTGIRDAIMGGYIDIKEIDIPYELHDQIARWLKQYEDAHYHQFLSKKNNETLDKQGREIAKKIKSLLPSISVSYFSSAELRYMSIDEIDTNL
jgi:hypothetical protein